MKLKSYFLAVIAVGLSVLSHAQCGPLATPYNQNNGQDGIMFDVTALTNIEITNFDINCGGATHDFEIYYRPGTHVGFENNAAGWNLIGAANGVNGPVNVATAIPATFSVVLCQGDVGAFYITSTGPGSIDYTNGAAVGNVIVADANLQIHTGTGKDYAWAASFTPRNPNVTVHYNCLAMSCCAMQGITANVGACVGGAYQTTGQVTFLNPPANGQMIVEDCYGNQQVFNPPFNSPTNYTITGQTPDGLPCDIQAYFTADPACVVNVGGYTAPTCPCNIDLFNANIGLCDQMTDTYCMSGDVSFTNPPGAGTLIVEVFNGTTTYDTTINMPFVSGQTWSICGIPSDGSASSVTVYFSNDPGCSSTINYTAPTSCACNADIGTFSVSTTGSTPNNNVLCYGDGINITTNNDWTGPGEMFNPPGPPYQPGVTWLIYSCPPTVGVTPQAGVNITTDPCFIGVATDNDIIDVNNGASWFDAYPPGTFTNNTVYFVPLTFYDQPGLTYSYVNGTIPCYEMGPVYDVQYLPQFTTTFTEDCLAGTADITVNGGLPAVNGSNFTASNLLPATASFVNTTATDGGVIQISGLQGGDMWSFDLVDGNGCPYTVSGGPFPPLENPSFNYTQTSWCTAEPPMAPTITGTPGGSFTSAPAGLSLNAGNGQITPGTSTPGTYSVTYTTPGACFDDSTITVNIAATPTVNPVANQTICHGTNFVDIIFTGSAGTVFDWTNDNTNIGLAASGTGDILSFTGTAPIVTETANITVTPTAGACVGLPIVFTLTVDPIEDPGFNYAQTSWCTSEAAMTPTITGTPGGTFTSAPAGLSLNATTGQIIPSTSTPGTYSVTYTTPGTCFDDSTITVNIAATPTVNPIADQTVCHGTNFTDIIFTGSAGTVFDWTNSNINIGLGASGTGDILAFPGTAPTVQEMATITVTPTAGACVGPTETFNLTVNPLDDASFNYAQTAWCTSEAPMTPTITGTAGGNFTSAPAGLSLNAATGEITPATSTPGTYTVTYTTPGICFVDSTITINIAATPSVNPIANQTVCDGVNFADIIFTGSAGTVFDWVNDNTNIGLAGSGTGDILAFAGTAPAVQEVANITVTPTAGSCVGTPEVFTLTVDPQDDASYSYSAAGWCTSDVVQSPVITGTAGGTFSAVPAGLSINAVSGDIDPSLSTPGSYTVTYTTPGPCVATANVFVDIYAVPTVDPVADETVCVNTLFSAVNFTGAVAGTTYDWTNDNTNIGLAGSGTGNIAAFPGATTGGTISGNITVTPSTANCVGNPETFILTVNDMDDASFSYSPGSTYCQTAADPVINITGLNGGSFTYATVSGGPNLDLDPATGDIILLNSDLGSFDVTYSTAGAGGSLCPNTSIVNITITAAPVADFTLGQYCAQDVDPLPTFINGGSAGNFSSAPAGLVINPATGEVDLNASMPGTYTVTNDINVAGCPMTSYNDDITIFEMPDATISGSTNICQGDPLPDVTIDITAGTANWDVTYNYNSSPTTVNAAASPYVISGAALGTYDLVSITDGNGCTSQITGQVIIGQFPTPVVDPLVNQAICEADQLTVQTFTSTPPGSTFDWTNTSGTDVGFGLNGTGQIGSFNAINTTGLPEQVSIDVVPTSSDGCVGPTETFVITVNPLPVVSFTGTPLTGCEPLDVSFTNTTSPAGQYCEWSFGDGNFTQGCSGVANTYSAGTYDVSLTVVSAEGCSASITYNDYVVVSAAPDANFTYLPQTLDVSNPVVEFTNNSTNATSYEWDYGDNSPNDFVENPTHEFPSEPSEYHVTLIAYDANGWCPDTTDALITVDDVILFYVPNIITPDGDLFNEVFTPVFTSGFDPYNYHLTIFNRWGEIIFESYNAEKGWNGHYGDGGLVQDGVYIWQIEFKETMSDKRHRHRGHVTVLK